MIAQETTHHHHHHQPTAHQKPSPTHGSINRRRANSRHSNSDQQAMERQRKCSVCGRTSPKTIFSCRYKVNERNIEQHSAFFNQKLEYGELCDRCYRSFYKHKKSKQQQGGDKKATKSSKKRKLLSKDTTDANKTAKQSTAVTRDDDEEDVNVTDRNSDDDDDDSTPTSSSSDNEAPSRDDSKRKRRHQKRRRSSSSSSSSSSIYSSMASPYMYGYVPSSYYSPIHTAQSPHSYPFAVPTFSPYMYNTNVPNSIYGMGAYYSTALQQHGHAFGTGLVDSTPLITDAAKMLLTTEELNGATSGNGNLFRRARIRYAPTQISKRLRQEEDERALKEIMSQRNAQQLEFFRITSRPGRKSRRKNSPQQSPAQTDNTFDWLHSGSMYSQHRLPTMLQHQTNTAIEEEPLSEMSATHHLHPEFQLDSQKTKPALSLDNVTISSEHVTCALLDDHLSHMSDSDGTLDVNSINSPSHGTEESQNIITDSFGDDTMMVKSPKMKGATPRLEAVEAVN